jgi:hypothetical protein
MKYNQTVKKRDIGKFKETRIHVTKSGKNKDLESAEVRALYNGIMKVSQDDKYDTEILVVASNPLQRTWTLKGFQTDDLKFDDYDEYFENRVKDPSKFAKFDSLIFVVKATLKPVKKDKIKKAVKKDKIKKAVKKDKIKKAVKS